MYSSLYGCNLVQRNCLPCLQTSSDAFDEMNVRASLWEEMRSSGNGMCFSTIIHIWNGNDSSIGRMKKIQKMTKFRMKRFVQPHDRQPKPRRKMTTSEKREFMAQRWPLKRYLRQKKTNVLKSSRRRGHESPLLGDAINSLLGYQLRVELQKIIFEFEAILK